MSRRHRAKKSLSAWAPASVNSLQMQPPTGNFGRSQLSQRGQRKLWKEVWAKKNCKCSRIENKHGFYTFFLFSILKLSNQGFGNRTFSWVPLFHFFGKFDCVKFDVVQLLNVLFDIPSLQYLITITDKHIAHVQPPPLLTRLTKILLELFVSVAAIYNKHEGRCVMYITVI